MKYYRLGLLLAKNRRELAGACVDWQVARRAASEFSFELRRGVAKNQLENKSLESPDHACDPRRELVF
jgi:hypothetical protein